ncbi:hypothetical protein M3223_09145 [Paenibacillus pasadenensis]|uniref:RNA polymerase sigma factor n=1 Tax=Paenibacillus pasadenensis TaxID=217090 RepID=UPI00203E289C|nr:sigma factor [Paenibacillus pasadenensis]MCM3747520.1 hypothetical protein [Paenibacillus pasadenensis]
MKQTDRQQYDILRSYAKPIFGYALNKVRQREEAEDLAQEIMLQLFKSVSSGAFITNLDAYVWTFAKYTWVNWLKKRSYIPAPTEIIGLPEPVANQCYEPKRKDGGHYIAFASVEQDRRPELSYNPQHYSICGTMVRYRAGSPLYLWQLNTYWSERKDWRDLNFDNSWSSLWRCDERIYPEASS